MALSQSALLEVLDALNASDSTDVIRHASEVMLQQLIDAEATAFIGAEPHERTEARVTQRNGTRSKTITTRQALGGTPILAVASGERASRGCPQRHHLSPDGLMLYTPLPPDVAAGQSSRPTSPSPFALCARAAEILRGRATALDEASRTVAIEAELGPTEVSYRRLVIALALPTARTTGKGRMERGRTHTPISRIAACCGHGRGALLVSRH